ncbi:hypothetical protein Goe7_c01770 [Bacillus phage vB_BveM-Goe7]|nr:hypothetical protein Goe7_c01770 [Bacillus phage vB_BveM-Goe7]
MLFDTRPITRYERQLENVDHLVLHSIREKHGINISMKELYQILETLYEYRVVD